MWIFAPAIACGNAFILKPSERDPGVPMRLAELMIEAGLPAGHPQRRQRRQGSGRRHPRRSATSRRSASSARRRSPNISMRAARANGKRVQCFGGAKNHMIIMPDADMDQAVDALIGAGYGSAGERCMAISVAVPVGKKTADALVEKLMPRVESLKIGPSTDPAADFGPLVTRERARAGQELYRYRRQGRRQARGRRPRLQDAGLRERLLHGRLPVRPRHPGHAHLQGRDLRPGAAGRARARLRRSAAAALASTNTATASPSSPATAMRRANSRRRCKSAWSASTCRSRCRSPITPSAAGSAPASATSTSTARTRPLLHQDQDGHLALALGRQGRRRVRHSDDGLSLAKRGGRRWRPFD